MKFYLRLCRIFLMTSFLALTVWPRSSAAHEAYVLSGDQFHAGLKTVGLNAFTALRQPDDFRLFLVVTSAILAILVLNFFWQGSKNGQTLASALDELRPFGPLIVRIAISASFFYSAASWSFLGPELPLTDLPGAAILRLVLFASSGLILAGLLTELAALGALVIFGIAVAHYGLYLITYLNYFGEIIILLAFGSRFLSFDRHLFGSRRMVKKWQEYESAIIRVFYGIALSFTAISVKLLHPRLTVAVVQQYHLAKFHYLFPHDPLLIALGAGLAELAIGIFIIFGFELRLTVFISLIYLTLSLIYFRELVWPHLLLYGISLNLIINPGRFTLDHWLKRNL